MTTRRPDTTGLGDNDLLLTRVFSDTDGRKVLALMDARGWPHAEFAAEIRASINRVHRWAHTGVKAADI